MYSSSLLYSFEERLRSCSLERAAQSAAESTPETRGSALAASAGEQCSASEAEALSEKEGALALALVTEAEEQLAATCAEPRARGTPSRTAFGTVAVGGSGSLARGADAELEDRGFEVIERPREARFRRGCECLSSLGFPNVASATSFDPLCLRRAEPATGADICEEAIELLAGNTRLAFGASGSATSRRSASVLEPLALLLLEAVDDSDEVSPRSRSRSR